MFLGGRLSKEPFYAAQPLLTAGGAGPRAATAAKRDCAFGGSNAKSKAIQTDRASAVDLLQEFRSLGNIHIRLTSLVE